MRHLSQNPIKTIKTYTIVMGEGVNEENALSFTIQLLTAT